MRQFLEVVVAEDVAAIPSVHTGTKYVGEIAPERRRVEGSENAAPSQEERKHSDVEAGVKQVGKPKDEMADSDDTDSQKNFLMQAWQAMVMYVSTCEDEDQQAAVQALKMITNLMSGTDEPNQPSTTGAFNVTSMAGLYDPACDRAFSTEAGLVNHIKAVHNHEKSGV